ncbi:hypothetical protein Y1Q_0000749 [Alligator mississippiensis]|uniref:Uncharacterized protein n=1 Tax=Alligator mississippiensis TaxID=8496 RepID=A0A151MCB4_ALLMI|nr:hypothetical protein Y1Q_0000749 [Alligator mississippiensis]
MRHGHSVSCEGSAHLESRLLYFVIYTCGSGSSTDATGAVAIFAGSLLFMVWKPAEQVKSGTPSREKEWKCRSITSSERASTEQGSVHMKHDFKCALPLPQQIFMQATGSKEKREKHALQFRVNCLETDLDLCNCIHILFTWLQLWGQILHKQEKSVESVELHPFPYQLRIWLLS